MIAQYPTTCRACGAKIPAGAQCSYDRYAPRGKRATCSTCAGKAPAPPARKASAAPTMKLLPPMGCARPDADLAALSDPWPSGSCILRLASVRDGMALAWHDGGASPHLADSGHHSPSEWSGYHASAEAAALAAENPPDAALPALLASAADIRRGIEERPEVVLAWPKPGRRHVHRLADGDEIPDVLAWRQDPDHAWSAIRRTARPRAVRVPIPWSAMCGMNAASLATRAAACVAAVEALSVRGVPCEVVALDMAIGLLADDSAQVRIVSCTLKRAADPLDLRALAGAIMDPVTQRWAGRPAMVRTLDKAPSWGWGRAATPSAAQWAALGLAPLPLDWSMMSTTALTMDQAVTLAAGIVTQAATWRPDPDAVQLTA